MRPLGAALFYSCRKAGELMERRYTVPLSSLETLRLKTHLALCLSCRRYEKQSRQLEEFLDRYRNPGNVEEWTEPELKDLEARIFEKLSDKS